MSVAGWVSIAVVLGYVGWFAAGVALDYRKYRRGEESYWGEWKRVLGRNEDETENEEMMEMTWCNCRFQCGDRSSYHDRKGAACKALPGSWALVHEHLPVPGTPPFDWACRICGHRVDIHAREAAAVSPVRRNDEHETENEG